jgi:hypothetical protein
MKTIFKMFLVVLMTFVVLPAMAQDTASPDTFQVNFQSIASISAMVIFLSSVFNNLLNLKSWKKQAVSWIISLIITLLGWKFQVGLFAGASFVNSMLYGAGIALVSNGIFDIALVKQFLAAVKLEPQKHA